MEEKYGDDFREKLRLQIVRLRDMSPHIIGGIEEAIEAASLFHDQTYKSASLTAEDMPEIIYCSPAGKTWHRSLWQGKYAGQPAVKYVKDRPL